MVKQKKAFSDRLITLYLFFIFCLRLLLLSDSTRYRGTLKMRVKMSLSTCKNWNFDNQCASRLKQEQKSFKKAFLLFFFFWSNSIYNYTVNCHLLFFFFFYLVYIDAHQDSVVVVVIFAVCTVCSMNLCLTYAETKRPLIVRATIEKVPIFGYLCYFVIYCIYQKCFCGYGINT